MNMINRMALTIRPKQPYIDWADSFDDGGPRYNPEHDNPCVYLIDEIEDVSDVKKIVKRYWQAIFEESLSAWMNNPEDWPEKLSLKMLLEWFEVEVSDLVFDLGRDMIDAE